MFLFWIVSWGDMHVAEVGIQMYPTAKIFLEIFERIVNRPSVSSYGIYKFDVCVCVLLKWQPYVGLNFSIVMFHLFHFLIEALRPHWKRKLFSTMHSDACEFVSCDDEYVLFFLSLIRFIRYTIYRDLVWILWPMAHWLCIM